MSATNEIKSGSSFFGFGIFEEEEAFIEDDDDDDNDELLKELLDVSVEKL
jgi:hypothetical protein